MAVSYILDGLRESPPMLLHQEYTMEGYLRVGTLNGVKIRPRTVKIDEGRSIAVFYHNGEVYAVENRCPHVGYPLETGSVRNGVLTCMWHQARFELATGNSLDPSIEDIETFPVTIVEGEVWVNPVPRPQSETTNSPS
jgi:nitrite reductase/ring-hydroxylating ferredoxin subunit